jgi:signal transduction histidine kinase
MSDTLEPDRLRALIDVGGFIVSELDLDAVLGQVLESACELTGARYAAMGVLDADRTGLERFITRGIDDEVARVIGELPRGRGVLGALIESPQPLRLHRVGDHQSSYGFPAGHPPMDSFLGVPVFIRGQVWGNLYLCEKRSGDFDEADENAIVVLARWAGIAVENARLYQIAEQGRSELERAVRGFEATQAVALAIGADIELERVLELIVKRGRALVEARCVVILLRDPQGESGEEELVLVASAGEGGRLAGTRVPVAGSTSGEVMLSGRARRLEDASHELRVPAETFGVDGAQSALLVPLAHRGDRLGVLVAFDHVGSVETFSADEEQVLKAFAASAATAVAAAQGVEQQRLSDTLAAAEAERRRWAQELHDETLQSLGGLRMLLASARRSGDAQRLETAADDAIVQIEQEITNLRAIITELRPAALDELGLAVALEALLDRHRVVDDFDLTEDLDLPDGEEPAAPEIEAALYRVVQEALTNVAKHAHATSVKVTVRIDEGRIVAEIADDGRGFTPETAHGGGFGLTGMRERVLVVGGELRIESAAGGTTVVASLPRTRIATGSVAALLAARFAATS